MNRKKIILSILLGIIAISAMIISDKLYKEKDKRLFSFSKEQYEPIIIKDKSDFKDELRTIVKQNIQI